MSIISGIANSDATESAAETNAAAATNAANIESQAALTAASDQSGAAMYAADIQAQMAQQALALQQSMYDQNVAREQPWVTSGTNALQQLTSQLPTLTKPYNLQSYYQSPEYAVQQAGVNQQNNALMSLANAQGAYGSGNMANALTANAQQSAMQGYSTGFNDYWTQNQNIYNMLNSQSQIGENAAAGVGAMGTNVANSMSNTLQASGNAQASGLNNAALAAAAGLTGSANAIGTGLTSAAGANAAGLLGSTNALTSGFGTTEGAALQYYLRNLGSSSSPVMDTGAAYTPFSYDATSGVGLESTAGSAAAGSAATDAAASYAYYA